MSGVNVELILKEVEALLARAGVLPPEAEVAVEKLLNVVEALSSDKNELAEEVERLRKQLEQKKKNKTTANQQDDGQDNGQSPQNNDHSSEKHRRERDKKRRPARDRRSFKDVPIHREVECPVDPTTLPPDAVRVADETVVVQDVEIKPSNTRFTRHVYYSDSASKYFRGALPAGCDQGDFGADLRALIVSLKYCGNMSEPKIRELGGEAVDLLQTEFNIPNKWLHAVAHVGSVQFDRESLKPLLDGWFGDGNQQVRTAIEHATAIVHYRHQTLVPVVKTPVVKTLVCDDAGQFKLLTLQLALCWPLSLQTLARAVITRSCLR